MYSVTSGKSFYIIIPLKLKRKKKTRSQLQMFSLSTVHFCWLGNYSRGGDYPQIYFSTTISKIQLHSENFNCQKILQSWKKFLTVIAQ